MITRFRVQNFKALKDVTLDLTPLHVLISPNDSGKPSLLEAVAALCRSTDHNFADAFRGSWEGTDLVNSASKGSQVEIAADLADSAGEFSYALTVRFSEQGRNAWATRESLACEGESHEMPSILISQKRSAASLLELDRAPTGPVVVNELVHRLRNLLRRLAILKWKAEDLGTASALNLDRH